MKIKISPHKNNIGPQYNIDLKEVAAIAEYGQRSGKSGFIKAEFLMRSGEKINISMSPNDLDDTVSIWENLSI